VPPLYRIDNTEAACLIYDDELEESVR
jgi:hypothetical protein